LAEDDLEPDVGDPPPVEQPTQINTEPLSPKYADDRVRMIFGLTTDDPLPPIDEGSLRRYHEHLKENVPLPFKARLIDPGYPPPGRKVEVRRLLDFDPDQLGEGVLCEAADNEETFVVPLVLLSPFNLHPRQRAVGDYVCWFQASDFSEPDQPDL